MVDGRMFTEAGEKKVWILTRFIVSVDMTAKKWEKSLKTTSRDRVTGIFFCSSSVKKYYDQKAYRSRNLLRGFEDPKIYIKKSIILNL